MAGRGRPKKFKSPDTKPIRVPAHLTDRLIEIAHKLESGESINETNSDEVIKVRFYKLHGEWAVKVSALEELGINLKDSR